MTEEEQDKLAEAIGVALGGVVRELKAEIEGLRSEIKQFVFKGTFQENKQYRRGNFVGLGGSIYHCQADTTTRPGTDDKVWCLAVPRARDGRDGKDYAPPPPNQRTARSSR
jgi:hypothetical protein